MAILDFKKNIFSIDEETHTYSKNGEVIPHQISGTRLMKELSEFDFAMDKQIGIIMAILRKVGQEQSARQFYAYSKKHIDDYMASKANFGIKVHKAIENKQIPYVEKLLGDIREKCNIKNDLGEVRELIFMDELPIFNLVSTIDYFAIDRETKNIVLIDFKVSGQDKSRYLKFQLNLYLKSVKKFFDSKGLTDFNYHLYGIVINQKTKNGEIKTDFKVQNIDIVDEYEMDVILDGLMIYKKWWK